MSPNKVELYRDYRVGPKKINGIFLVTDENGSKVKMYLELKEEEILICREKNGNIFSSSIIQSNEEYEEQILRMQELLKYIDISKFI